MLINLPCLCDISADSCATAAHTYDTRQLIGHTVSERKPAGVSVCEHTHI